MIDEYSQDRTGWARFSDDRTMRYRLGRKLTARALEVPWPSETRCCLASGVPPFHHALSCRWRLVRVVFVMLNPSTADAFKLDPTVQKCCKFALAWGGDVCEVVNIYALRSTDPAALYPLSPGNRGATPLNDGQIREACRNAHRVVAAWGNHGELGGRGAEVRDMLHDVELLHLGTTQSGSPLHPLARGKAFIPIDREPTVWE